MKVTYSGKATTATPAMRMRCATKSAQGRFSTISVLDLLLDEAELHHRERDHDDHEDHRLRRRPAQVGRLHAVVVHLVDEDLRRPRGPALRRRVDHPEGVEERVDDVDDE